MFEKNQDFSKADLAALLRQPEARALLARLQQMDQSTLQQAVDRAFRGDTSGLQPLMQDEQVQRLAQTMRNGHGGI